MKRVFIVHGWDFSPESNWYLLAKKELEKKGFSVQIPAMPNTAEPDIPAWVSHLKKTVGTLDAQTYFVSHSIGCQTVMRLLEREKYTGKIGGAVFVAGWFKLKNLEGEEVEAIAQPWLTVPINLASVAKKITKLSVFLSDDDPYDCLSENEIIFKNTLGAQVHIEHGMGHFTDDEGSQKLSAFVKRMVKEL